VVLSTAATQPINPWLPTDLRVTNPITGQSEQYSSRESIGAFNPNSPGLSNEGKVVSGTDRAGDHWTITVHGPGKVIVTDTTPNDGALDDDINTIQLINTNPRTTYVTGNVIESNTVQTGGVIPFNELIDVSGVKSIVLNGFMLTSFVTPAVTNTTGIFLYGGVSTLSFDSIDAQIDTSVNPTPYQIIIGDATTPLKVQPSIYINSILNLVYNGDGEADIPSTPVTSPSVQFIINGVLRNFDITTAGQGNVPAAYQFEFPIVGTTGRTAVQATAIKTVNVKGSARNLTLSRGATPFSSDGSGLKYLKKATFGGLADGVGIDVRGAIGKLKFENGLGDPSGVFTSNTSASGAQPATDYGIPVGSTGYPAAGYLGGQIRAKKIHSISVKTSDVLVQTPQDPTMVQPQNQGIPLYIPSPGYALTNVVITTSGSIDNLTIEGSSLYSEVKTGFNFTNYLNGLEGTTNTSEIANLQINGDLINSPISASYIPANTVYQHGQGQYGYGQIKGKYVGTNYTTTGLTGLGNSGSGLFARNVKVKRVVTNRQPTGKNIA
jgi:hypothetical protein